MSLKQLYSCESSSYQTYKPLGVPLAPPPWPKHIIRVCFILLIIDWDQFSHLSFQHGEILRALVLAGPEDLFPLNIRWAILRAAVLWTIRMVVPELSSVFPDEVVKTLKGGSLESETDQKYIWGTVENSGYEGSREELLELWFKYKEEYIVAFGMEKLECPPEEQEMF
jgi:hypothetical protein